MSINIKYSARFRDAVFYFSGNAPTTGGRKTITREFPGSDRRYVEDLGLLNKTFEIEAIVTTEEEKEKLIAALETPGIGQLSHPTFGLINVTARPYTVVDNIQNIGYCTFNLIFDVSQENIYPEANASNISFLQSKVSFLDNSILANFADKLGISPATLQTAIETATMVIDTIDSATNMVDEVKEEVLAVKEGIVALIQAPAAFIGSIKSVINSVISFIDDPKAAFDILKNMFNFKRADSTKTKEEQRVFNTIVQAVNSQVLSKTYDLSTEIQYENNEQLDSVQNELETLYENLIDNPTDFLIENPEDNLESTSVLESLQEVRQLAETILSEKENTVARIIEVNTYDTTLNDFVFTYYGNLDNLDKIESINNIEDRSNISGTLKVLSQ